MKSPVPPYISSSTLQPASRARVSVCVHPHACAQPWRAQRLANEPHARLPARLPAAAPASQIALSLPHSINQYNEPGAGRPQAFVVVAPDRMHQAGCCVATPVYGAHACMHACAHLSIRSATNMSAKYRMR